jgi:hypothetical protein
MQMVKGFNSLEPRHHLPLLLQNVVVPCARMKLQLVSPRSICRMRHRKVCYNQEEELLGRLAGILGDVLGLCVYS